MSKSFSSFSKFHTLTEEYELRLYATVNTILGVFFPLKNSVQEYHIFKWLKKNKKEREKKAGWVVMNSLTFEC